MKKLEVMIGSYINQDDIPSYLESLVPVDSVIKPIQRDVHSPEKTVYVAGVTENKIEWKTLRRTLVRSIIILLVKKFLKTVPLQGIMVLLSRAGYFRYYLERGCNL